MAWRYTAISTVPGPTGGVCDGGDGVVRSHCLWYNGFRPSQNDVIFPSVPETERRHRFYLGRRRQGCQRWQQRAGSLRCCSLCSAAGSPGALRVRAAHSTCG